MDDSNQVGAGTNSSGSKKWLYVVIGVVVVLALLGFAVQNAGFMAMRAAGVNVVPNADGTGAYTVTTNEGTATVGGNKMPDNWPSDAPGNFVGATIQYSGSSNPQTGQTGAAVMYTASASVSAVVDFYKQELAAKGWSVEGTANMGVATVLSAKKGDRTFGVQITDAGNGMVQVVAGLGM